MGPVAPVGPAGPCGPVRWTAADQSPALVRDGNTVAAGWMRERYDVGRAVRVSDLPPIRRHICERTEILAADIRAVLASAWPPSSPRAFRDELARAGQVLA